MPDQPLRTLIGIWWGTHQLSGYAIETIALLAAVGDRLARCRGARGCGAARHAGALCGGRAAVRRVLQGHPYRIRYMIPVVAACAVFGGLARRTRIGATGNVDLRPRRSWPGCCIALSLLRSNRRRGTCRRRCCSRRNGIAAPASAGATSPPAWRASTAARRCWRAWARSPTTCRSSRATDSRIADFINEGNGVIWNLALQTGPAPHAGWMLVEEVAEGGDVLAEHVRHDPAFTRGMTRVCEGGGVALYNATTVYRPKSHSYGEEIGPAAEVDASALRTVAADPLQPPDSGSRRPR